MDAYGLVPARTGELERLQPGCSSVRGSAEKLLQSVWGETAGELSRLVCAMGIDSGRAEDVLQEVYVTAWRKCPEEADRVGLKRWLLRVTINRCNLEHRRRARWWEVLHGLARFWSSSDPAGDPAQTVAEGEQRELVRRGLGQLEPQLRSVLVLRYFAEFDSREIGRILELPDTTVRSRLRAARKQLAQELKRSGYHHD
ncbi:MAG: RNA polymerase sigma factor [Planctomycetota bacterium]|jgi:RNA polymerase sigma-70 factor (ECF subfamily)